ncbi:MAG: hypothetical protein M3P42_07495 [Actinomycetota bacterium]|nr:hypothetical protein [Actinomycetota bacterium]
MRRLLLVLGVLAAMAAMSATPALAVSGAGYTTVNPAVDGPNHCKNGNPGVNCNIYDGKQYVWLNGGPAANGLGPDSQYFFAVLVPGGQPNPNDGGPKNLSDDFDAYTNRTFTVTNGEVSAYAGTHTATIPLIRLFPYADTTNPGGVYIMAICSLGAGYPVEPRDCKYDAFKVKQGVPRIQRVLSGTKYLDENKNGQRDAGEPGLKDWSVTISGTDGTNVSVTTNGAGDWSYTTGTTTPSPGTTTYTVSEVQQSGWLQTGNTVDQSTAMGGASVALVAFTYTVTMPNDAISAVEQLNFGNVRDGPPVCPPPTFGTNAQGVPYMQLTVQDSDSGLASIEVTYTKNITVDIAGFFFGTTSPVVVTGTAIDPLAHIGLTFIATDLLGNQTTCDPIVTRVVRENGKPADQTFTGLPDFESKVTVSNGSPGVRTMDIVVNGITFKLTGLRAGEIRTIDVASAMLPGNDNVISLAGYGGGGGGSAMVMIAN